MHFQDALQMYHRRRDCDTLTDFVDLDIRRDELDQ
jgi:hypothetical protein